MKNILLSNTFQVEVGLVNVYHAKGGEGNTDEEHDAGEPDVQAVPLFVGHHPVGSADVDVPERHDPNRKNPVKERN